MLARTEHYSVPRQLVRISDIACVGFIDCLDANIID